MLKRGFKSFVTIVVVLMLAACSGEKQNIVVEKRVSDENKYEEFNKVTDTKQVEEVRAILSDTHWTEAQVDFIRPPDYQFIYEFKNPDTEAKPVLYKMWISPKKDSLEVIQGEYDYAHLPKKESARLFEILTGESLGE
ncbi:hypothetical protein [Rossellomorea sp. YZS02]|uniref:hypothetical protein n=1 Tax=Rossellomorea sp. YZS02 TaxID=3097358 RepID=UPI002A153A6C|nr:hypothetical protein [Rossellomorea sp. YZS02]MDX8342456.1 hypothetical protein [Rossellomorea sp. YZS02]